MAGLPIVFWNGSHSPPVGIIGFGETGKEVMSPTPRETLKRASTIETFF